MHNGFTILKVEHQLKNPKNVVNGCARISKCVVGEGGRAVCVSIWEKNLVKSNFSFEIIRLYLQSDTYSKIYPLFDSIKLLVKL